MCLIHQYCLHLTRFFWHAIFGLLCRTGTVPVPVYIIRSRSILISISGTYTVVLVAARKVLHCCACSLHSTLLQQECSIALALASSRLPNSQSASWCRTPRAIGSGSEGRFCLHYNIEPCRTIPAHQTRSYRAGLVQHGTHLFTVDAVRTQCALELWCWSSVNGV